MSTVIAIDNLWKEYRLGVISHGTLSQDLQSWWARIRGKEDPNSRIGTWLPGQEQQIEGNHFWALRQISLSINSGEVVGIIGKNGAGKSTLLKILSRITAPTKGEIKIKGRIASLLEVGTGFHPELTGRENIFLNGAILGMTKREIKSRLDEIVDFSGVEDFVDTPVKRYSSGMYVRLAFAVAAHLDPEVLIVDEVLAVGDAEFQKKAIGKMGELSTSAGRTVLVVSHNMNSIEQLCDRTAIVEGGRVSYIGSTTEAITTYLGSETGSHSIENIETKTDWVKINKFKLERHSGSIEFNSEIRLLLEIQCNRDVDVDIRMPISNSRRQRIGTIRKKANIAKGRSTLVLSVTNQSLSLGKYTLSLNIKGHNTWITNQQDILEFRIIDGNRSANYDLMINKQDSLGCIYEPSLELFRN